MARAVRYLKVLWIFLLGMALTLYGFYMLISFGQVGLKTIGSSFYVMLIGLLLTGVGSIYGKKKLRDRKFKVEEVEERARQDTNLGFFMSGQKIPHRKQSQLQLNPYEAKRNGMVPMLSSDRPQPPAVATYKVSTGEHDTISKERIVKIIICSSCGVENQENYKFCFNCGRKLRLPMKTASAKKK